MSETTIHDGGTAPEPDVPPAAGPAPGTGPDPGAGGAGSLLRSIVVVAALVVLAVRWPIPVLVVAAVVFFVFVHELGHYLTAKWAGMKVTEFFIGFGPRIWSFRRGETEYGIKPIPAGAYVKIIGMNNMEEVDPAEEHRTYRQKPYWRRLSVAVAGSTMHFLMAIVLMFSLLVGFGVPDPDPDPASWSVRDLSSLDDGPSPAAQAGIEPGDRVVAVDGRRFESFEALADHVRSLEPGTAVTLTVERDGGTFTATTELGARTDGDETVGFLGVSPTWPLQREDPLTGAGLAVRETGSAMVLSVQGIVQFFSPSGMGNYVSTLVGDPPESEVGATEGAEHRVLSPVGAVNVASQAAESGWADLIWFLFIINVFIGVINLFPMLPFDGGHVVIATYEKIRSRGGERYHADITKVLPVAYAVFALFIFVGLSALYLDILNPIRLS